MDVNSNIPVSDRVILHLFSIRFALELTCRMYRELAMIKSVEQKKSAQVHERILLSFFLS